MFYVSEYILLSIDTPFQYFEATGAKTLSLFSLSLLENKAPGGVVVKALRYKTAGRGFYSRWCHWNFSVT